MRKDFIKKIAASSILCSVLTCYAMPAIAYSNEESVYSNLKSNGDKYKTTVSIVEGEGDKTEIKKEEIEKELPIDCKVTYKLDGEEISAEDIVGKKGNVTITLKYVNKDEQQVWINGQNEKMYTPFLVISGVIVDNKNNQNIQINHGKLINNGETTIAAGFAIPGLAQSLKLDNSNLDICDTIQISMETQCFELNNIITYASPKIFSSLNIQMEDFNSLFNKVDELQDASNKIENGARALNDGIIVLDNGVTSLQEGSKSLNSGVESLNSGAKQINDGAVNLKNGMEEYSSKTKQFNQAVCQVSSGANELNTKYQKLNSGIDSLNKNTSTIEEGAKSLSEGSGVVSNGLSKISTNLDNVSSNVTKLKDVASTTDEGVSQIINGIKYQIDNPSSSENVTSIKSAIATNNSLIEKLNAQNEELRSLTDVGEDVQIVLNSQIEKNNEMIASLNSTNTSLTNGLQSSANQMEGIYSNLVKVQAGTTALVTGTSSLDSGIEEISLGTADLAKGASSLAKGASDLYGGTVSLSEGTSVLAAGSEQVAQGISTLNNGASSLSGASNQLTEAATTISNGTSSLQTGTSTLLNGTNSLVEGTSKLVNGVNSLSDGSKQLVSGSNSLVDGINRFNSEGVTEICRLVNNNGKNLIRRIEKLEELSENYSSFLGNKDTEEVQFFSIMDSISTADIKNKKEE